MNHLSVIRSCAAHPALALLLVQLTLGGCGKSLRTEAASSPRPRYGGDEVRVETIKPGFRTAWSDFVPRPTVALGDCQFSGSVEKLHAPLYVSASGGESVALVRQAHFSRIKLPMASDHRVEADMSWPLLGRFYLGGASPLRPKKSVSLAGDHFTIPSGASHVITHTDGDSGLLHLALSSEHVYQMSIPCSALTFREAADRDWGARLPPNARGLRKPTMLYDGPNGRTLGFVGSWVDSVLIQEERASWARVSSIDNGSLLFNGWMETRELKAEPNYIGLLREDPIKPSHLTRSGARIHVRGQALAVEVAPDTPVLVGARAGGLVEVAIAGLWEGESGNLSLLFDDLVAIDG